MKRLFATLAVLALAGCGGFPSATLDEPALCKTIADQPVPGVPAAANLPGVTLPLSLDLRPELSQLGVKSGHARVTSATLHARDGVSDLSFIHSVQVTLASDNQAVIDYQAITSGDTLQLNGTDADLLPAAAQGPLALQLTITGDMPSTAWHADVSVCIAVQATIVGG